jgi:hypothetical protein
MPIPVRCECGRSMRVKDEMAGKQGKCPSCGKLLVIPDVEKERGAEEEASAYLLADSPDEERPTTQRASRYRSDPEPEPEPPRRRPVPREEDGREETPRLDRDVSKKKSKPRRKEEGGSSGVAFEEGWFGSINSGVAGGVLMMLIAVVWFVAGVALINRIFIYPPILFVIGVIAFFKGLMGGE